MDTRDSCYRPTRKHGGLEDDEADAERGALQISSQVRGGGFGGAFFAKPCLGVADGD